MILSQSAQMCLEATWNRFANRTKRIPGQLDSASRVAESMLESEAMAGLEAQVQASVAASSDVAAADGRGLANDPLSPSERRARAAALRGLAFSRQRRFDAAQSAFAVAASLDPDLDLTRTPAFWRLERGAHEAAIAAYLDAGRERDATVLRARVQSTYRPRPVRTRAETQVAR